jgi:hypothetical protein
MRAMISFYRDDNDEVEFKSIHVFARIETCEKSTKTWTALTKDNAAFDPAATPTPASDGQPTGNKKAKVFVGCGAVHREARMSIMACIAHAATHAAKRAEQAAQM